MDYGLRNLLDLNGTVLVLNEAGYWVKFEVKQVQQTAERPHGIDYSLTLHGPDNERLVGFDNAHAGPCGEAVEGSRRRRGDAVGPPSSV